jgi:hypothetical protein
MYYDMLQVSPRTGPEKVAVCYARDEDWNPLVVKGPLSSEEINALVETERIKCVLDIPRTNVRRDDHGFIVADSLYDYDYNESHVCTSGIDKGVRLSNIKLKMWKHDTEDRIAQRSFLKALAFRLVIGTDDSVPRNFVVIGKTVYSVDDPAWKIEPTIIWKIKTHAGYYNRILDENWKWVSAFLSVWKKKAIGDFSIRMCNKYLKRENWAF